MVIRAPPSQIRRNQTQSDAISHLRRRERRRDRPLQMDHLGDALLLLCRDGAIEPSPQLGHLMRDAINQIRDAIKSHRAESAARSPDEGRNQWSSSAVKGPRTSDCNQSDEGRNQGATELATLTSDCSA